MKIILNVSGLDCSGKETFTKKVYSTLSDNGMSVFRNSIFSFPRYETTEPGRELYKLLRDNNKSEERTKRLDELFIDDHMLFLRNEFSSFLNLDKNEPSDGDILICDRCSHEPLLYHFNDDVTQESGSGSSPHNLTDMRSYDALLLLSNRHSKIAQVSSAFELNFFFMMNGKTDLNELERRLSLKVDKDSNETLSFQKKVNERFSEVFAIIDESAFEREIDSRVFNIGFSLSTPTDIVVGFFLSVCKLLEKYEHGTRTDDFRNEFNLLVKTYCTQGYICLCEIL